MVVRSHEINSRAQKLSSQYVESDPLCLLPQLTWLHDSAQPCHHDVCWNRLYLRLLQKGITKHHRQMRRIHLAMPLYIPFQNWSCFYLLTNERFWKDFLYKNYKILQSQSDKILDSFTKGCKVQRNPKKMPEWMRAAVLRSGRKVSALQSLIWSEVYL